MRSEAMPSRSLRMRARSLSRAFFLCAALNSLLRLPHPRTMLQTPTAVTADTPRKLTASKLDDPPSAPFLASLLPPPPPPVGSTPPSAVVTAEQGWEDNGPNATRRVELLGDCTSC